MRGYEDTLDKIDWYRRECPRFIVCADSPRSIRKEKHPTYKAQRKEKPKPAVEALEGVIARVRAWGLPLVMVDGWEADDVIATLTRQAWPESVNIIGTEKDFFVLIEDGRVQLVGKQGAIDSAACYDKFGVAPCQMSDWLALVGDASDGIEGCEGWGPARATALLERYDTLDEALLSVRRGELSPGVLPGVGAKTIVYLSQWVPTTARELLAMNDRLEIDLVEILGGRND